MDIFEQLESATVLIVNGTLITNFGWNPDDTEDEWCLSVYGNSDDGSGPVEYYFDKPDMYQAFEHSDGFKIDGETVVFCQLIPVDKCP